MTCILWGILLFHIFFSIPTFYFVKSSHFFKQRLLEFLIFNEIIDEDNFMTIQVCPNLLRQTSKGDCIVIIKTNNFCSGTLGLSLKIFNWNHLFRQKTKYVQKQLQVQDIREN